MRVGSIEELEARVAALESQIVLIRQDAAAARVLAGGADREVSTFGAKLDAQKRLIEALRETQIEHGGRLDNLERRLDSLEREMRSGFAKLATGQAEILALLRRAD